MVCAPVDALLSSPASSVVSQASDGAFRGYGNLETVTAQKAS